MQFGSCDFTQHGIPCTMPRGQASVSQTKDSRAKYSEEPVSSLETYLGMYACIGEFEINILIIFRPNYHPLVVFTCGITESRQVTSQKRVMNDQECGVGKIVFYSMMIILPNIRLNRENDAPDVSLKAYRTTYCYLRTIRPLSPSLPDGGRARHRSAPF